MELVIVIAVVLAGVLGAVAGRLGRAVLSSLRRGVRPPPWRCEVAVAVLWSVVATRAATGGVPVWWAPVPLLLAWVGVLLAACDLLAARLPDALTLTSYPVLLGAVVVVAAVARSPAPAVSALLGSVLFAGVYALVHVLSPRSMGPGDVKLSGSLGAVVGAVSVPAVLVSMLATAVLSLLHAWRSGRASVPHGPAMLVPAWLVTALGPGPAVSSGGG